MKFDHLKNINRIKQQLHYQQNYKQKRKNMKHTLLKGFMLFCFCLMSGLVWNDYNSHDYNSHDYNSHDDTNQNTNTIKEEVQSVQGISDEKNTIFFPFKNLYVQDGDSFKASYKNTAMRIRLYGVDAPEKNQTHANISKSHLQNLLKDNRKVYVETLYHDTYGRAVAIVYFEDGTTAQELLLENGDTWLYTHFCKEPICTQWKEIEKEAKTQKKGLWQEKDAVAPWQWRKLNK